MWKECNSSLLTWTKPAPLHHSTLSLHYITPLYYSLSLHYIIPFYLSTITLSLHYITLKYHFISPLYHYFITPLYHSVKSLYYYTTLSVTSLYHSTVSLHYIVVVVSSWTLLPVFGAVMGFTSTVVTKRISFVLGALCRSLPDFAI